MANRDAHAPKTLLVMRHAKSSWDNPSGTDHSRPLDDRGRTDAPIMAGRIAVLAADHGLSIDAVVSSDARRAAETAGHVAAALGLDLTTTPDLYHASVAAWSEVVAGFPSDWHAAVAVAHNPGIGELLYRLDRIGDVPTGTVIHLRLPRWDALDKAELVGVLRPRDLSV